MMLSRAVAVAAPTPSVPDWQRDLDAAVALQTTLALASAVNPAADAVRRQHLGQLYGQLAERYPDQAEVQKAAGGYYNEVGQTDVALACWLRAEVLTPQDAALADCLGSAFVALGRAREACGQYERAVAARPDVPAYHFALANVLYLFRREVLQPPGRPDEQAALTEALAHFRRAAELAPADLQLAQAYAETFYIFAKPDWSQAFAAWKTVLALSGEDTDLANGHLARASLHLGKIADMETYLGRIRSPLFAPMKAKFRQQAATLAASDAANPTGSPATAPQ